MSSCFLCDTSYDLKNADSHYIYTSGGSYQKFYIKFMPIIRGTTGLYLDDQQHENNGKQNYVSYRVKKIEFCAYVKEDVQTLIQYEPSQVNYILIFKIPYREPAIDLSINSIKNFMLYSEPESVLKHGVYKFRNIDYYGVFKKQRKPRKIDLIVDKPFIVGPSDYVGVLYMFVDDCKIDSSAKVWFDIV